ncbi:MAG: class I SAM-dependent methyltransferase [Chloroflexota bacterium]
MSEPNYDLLSRYYDLEHDEFDDDVGLYLGFAARTGSPLLELGCGTGRLLLPLAAAGYRVTGVDVSAAMLAKAGERLAADASASARVSLVQADARDLALGERYALAFWAINSFMHLTTQADQLRALARTHDALRDSGLLILDLFSPEPQLLLEADGRLMHDASWSLAGDGGTVVKTSSRRLDAANQVLDVTYFYDEFTPDGQLHRVASPFAMRYLHRFEAQLLLERAGFVVEAVYGGYELNPFDSYSLRMIFVARKGH